MAQNNKHIVKDGEIVNKEDNRAAEEAEDTQAGRFLTFHVEAEIFGIEIWYVTEIVGMQEITAIPETPDYIRGIINLRGKIFPVIDVRTRFRKPPIEYNDRTCIIVVQIQEITVGLIVDGVAEVLSIDAANITKPPDQRTGIDNRFIKGIGLVGGQIKLLLDCRKLLKDDELKTLADIQ